MIIDIYPETGKYDANVGLGSDRHEKRCDCVATGRGNLYGLRKFYACSTEFFSSPYKF